MIDSSTFDLLPSKEARDFARAALGLLAESGVIPQQIRINEQNLISGNAEQDPAELTAQILEHRRVAQMLQTLQQLGEQFYKEMNHEA